MSKKYESYYKAHVDDEPVPMGAEFGEDVDAGIEEGNPNSRVNMLRTGSSGRVEYMAGIIYVDPCKSVETFAFDEIIHVLEGDIDVTVDGHLITLAPGDMVSFSKGQEATWHIKTPAKELFVAIDPD